ncbi:hypothetical protein EWM64_g8198 [Hericium alpestre]|uniref:1-alkyl-2-acetylglycerophosphocholine esterase n=1 Tax=Hericium alpestre TaxID=135208 RepID=A0A4Y9ZMG0_9AGAM|nr:hypothetical protein EWM64_g8198 [Hericium alpestre]
MWVLIPGATIQTPSRLGAWLFPLYSQICANLASSGKVVLALEHRDGTSPVCRIGSSDGKARAKFYINPEHVIWDDKDVPIARLALREEQLDFRQRELCHAYTAFRKLTCNGERGALQTMDGVLIDWSAWMPSDTEQWVRCESSVALAGHSFGGATVFSVLSNPPLESEPIIQIPVSHAIALDPWLEPLAYPGPAPISADDTPASHTKLLVINAEGFTLWKDHYARLLEVVPAWRGSYVLTMIGAKHVSFSDFPVMLPRLIRDPAAHRIIGIINKLVLAFVDDRLKEALDAPSMPTRKMEIQVDEPSWWSKKGNRRLVGQPGDVIVH